MTVRPPDPGPPEGDARRDPPPPSDQGTGEEAARILSEVMQDQREKRARQEESKRKKPRNDGPKKIVAVGMAVILLILMVARPDFLQPEPPPGPSRELVEAGLRMDMYRAAVEVQRFRERQGDLPPNLTAALEDDETDLRYTRLASGYYLVGERAGVEIVYRSEESLDALLADAREVIQRGRTRRPPGTAGSADGGGDR